jgi:signal peptidase II
VYQVQGGGGAEESKVAVSMQRKNIRYLVIAFIIILLDQISKFLIVRNLVENQAVSVIGDLLYFRFIYNEGGAMGTSVGPSWVYTILTLVALVFIIRYFLSSHSDGYISKTSLALILGGAVGNLIDRVIHGKVVDFIDADFIDIPYFNLYRWFTFNIADSAITIGLILFAISIIFKKHNEDNAIIRQPEATPPEVDSGQSQQT